MRKLLVVAILLTLVFFAPAKANAQTAIKFASLDVQFWPEYDQPSVLVIYDFSLNDVPLPVAVSLRIPSNADLHAVAENQNGSLIDVEHQPSTVEGNWSVVTFNVTDQAVYHIEYYAPLQKQGIHRQFVFNWPGDYAVDNMTVRLQDAVNAKNITSDPALPNVMADKDGFVYHSGTFSNLPAGENFKVSVSYDKSDDTLSASSLSVQPGGNGSLDQPAFDLNQWLPWILGIIGIILVVGGALWYWLAGRSGSRSKSRKRHTVEDEEEEEGNDENESTNIYCSQCGKRAHASDRFCRACGAKLRRNET